MKKLTANMNITIDGQQFILIGTEGAYARFHKVDEPLNQVLIGLDEL